MLEYVITYMYSGSQVLCILLQLHENQLTNFLHVVFTNLWSYSLWSFKYCSQSVTYRMTLYQLLYCMEYGKMIINDGWIGRDVGAQSHVLF
jgi:hypothetical protein